MIKDNKKHKRSDSTDPAIDGYTGLSTDFVKWLPRYSETMNNDEMGRWVRVAYAGKFNNIGFYKNKVCRWEIAWVKKLKTRQGMKFVISYYFSSNGKYVFDNLKSAQKEVEQTFDWFMKMCNFNL